MTQSETKIVKISNLSEMFAPQINISASNASDKMEICTPLFSIGSFFLFYKL